MTGSSEDAAPTDANRCRIHRPRDRRQPTQHNTRCELPAGHTGDHAAERLSREAVKALYGAEGIPATAHYAVYWSPGAGGRRDDTGPLPAVAPHA